MKNNALRLLLILGGAALLPSLTVIAPQPPPGHKPNIVFILADDLGYMDLRCYGNPFNETPHLDSLAKGGVRFTSAYSAGPVCSPSRAAILTGKYPARLQLTNFLVGERTDSTSSLLPADWRRYLPTSEVTLAELLKQQGYTTGMVGKWHLGSAGPAGDSLTPTAQGFDYERQIDKNGLDYYNYTIVSNTKTVFKDTGKAYLTDKLTDYALEFIEQTQSKKQATHPTRSGGAAGGEPAAQPFFLYLAYSAPHILLVPRADKLSKFLHRYPRFGGRFNPSYAAMLASLDEGVGRVLRKLTDAGLDNNTIVVFTSDNGGLGMPEAGPAPTDNSPLRRWKGHVYEGGIRVPMIVRWNGVTPPNATCDRYLTGTDFVPTFMEILRTGWKPTVPDGRSFYSLLRSPSSSFQRGPICWHYPHFSNQAGRPAAAIRDGDYKLVEHYETGKTELYNLANDLSEGRDLSETEPQRASALLAQLNAWRADVKANMPRPNPAFGQRRK